MIRSDYTPNTKVVYDKKSEYDTTVWQPHVYDTAIFLARRFGCKTIVDVGCGNAQKLAPVMNEFHIVGVDYGKNIELCRKKYPDEQWIEQDLEKPINLDVSHNSLIVCADVIEHLLDPTALCEFFKKAKCKALIISTPNRPHSHTGPPQKTHIREWANDEFESYIKQFIPVNWNGITKSNSNENSAWNTTMVVSVKLNIPEIWGKQVL